MNATPTKAISVPALSSVKVWTDIVFAATTRRNAMPKQYEAMRDKFAQGAMSLADAKTKAAKIYNAGHKKKMGGKHKTMDHGHKYNG